MRAGEAGWDRRVEDLEGAAQTAVAEKGAEGLEEG